MGMALDEPKEEDTTCLKNDLTFCMANDVESLINESGGLIIDYVDDGIRKGYTLKMANAADGCDSCGEGDCG